MHCGIGVFVSVSCTMNTITIDEAEDMDILDTQWGWYYMAACGKWHMFEVTPSENCSITTQDIELSYKTNPKGTVPFRTNKFNYILDFNEMKVTNLSTGEKQPIKRDSYSINTFSYIGEIGSISVPSHWEYVTNTEPFQLLPLAKSSNEFKEVADRVGRSMDSKRIENIQRIQNIYLWECYCRKKAYLKKIKNASSIKEEMLFHGTGGEFVEAICSRNFDWRLSGMHRALFGKGTYFAQQASHASQHSQNNSRHGSTLQAHGIILQQVSSWAKKPMFLARVLVGESVCGNASYMHPPSKDGSLVNFYDSCVDNIFNPLIYVIFDSTQIYPEYLIHFT
ncbi:protein mono-ADP-ribosyltransferase PARP11-like [Spea bombifrons]|uniref:protein mono-ADP-ribosyltransferase PARP11-like n=1 Tax=Spea bombifrons TaxID=233779 RepID=UPI0023492AE9|nr:protein mono-ADP-ribosyltransferase PARP11-like [Spea bombifrons]